MARLSSKTDLVNFIKMQLGYPKINIEVDDAQIRMCIDQAVQKFCDYAFEGELEGVVVLQMEGKGEYTLPDRITNIIDVSKGGGSSNITDFGTNYGNGYVPDVWSSLYFSNSANGSLGIANTTLTGSVIPAIIMVSNTTAMLQKYFGNAMYYHFNPAKKVLQVLENYTGPALVHYNYEYSPNDDKDYIFDHEWVKEYSTALTKRLWGSIVGKYSQALIGGAQINYSDIKSEAQQDMDRLNEELMTRWSDPVEIMIE